MAAVRHRLCRTEGRKAGRKEGTVLRLAHGCSISVLDCLKTLEDCSRLLSTAQYCSILQASRKSASQPARQQASQPADQPGNQVANQPASQRASQPARLSASEHDKEACKNASKQSSRGERKQGVSQRDPRGIPEGPREVPGCRGVSGSVSGGVQSQEGVAGGRFGGVPRVGKRSDPESLNCSQ